MHDVNTQTCYQTNLVGLLISKHQTREKIQLLWGSNTLLRKHFPNLGKYFAPRTLAAFGIPKRQNKSISETGAAQPRV